ncbi:DUF5457 domain-containing protein [Aquimarina rhabdastrellae]
MSTTTDLPIHEVILRIMYFEDKEKPATLSPEDILWKIDNPEITERYVKEVLNWLVRERKVTTYLNKYTLDRYEFLELKTRFAAIDDDEEITTFYIDPEPEGFSFKKWKHRIFLGIGVLLVLIMTYLFVKMQRDYQLSTVTPPISTIEERVPSMKKLYVAHGEDVALEEKFNGISYSFLMQNNNNRVMSNEVSVLYKKIDSLHQHYQNEINQMQLKVDKNINYNIEYTNGIIKKIMVCNVLFLGLIVIVFFRKR